jgi:hypothetical protein
MAVPISNIDVLDIRGALFSDAYQVPDFFSNRTLERDALVSAIRDATERQTVVISDSLGCGKTFLIDMVANDLGYLPRTVWPNVRSLEHISHAQNQPFHVVEDFDVKTAYVGLVKALDHIESIRAVLPPVLLLVGDYTLRNQRLLNHVAGQVTSVHLQPLEIEFFLQAMRLRIARFLNRHDDVNIFDLEFLEYLLPNTEPRVTTFREVFSILRPVANYLPVDRAPCVLSGREFSRVRPFEVIPPSSPQELLKKAILDFIRHEYVPAKRMTALDIETLRSMSCTTLSEEEFESTVVKPLVTIGFLRSTGTPYSRAADIRDRFPPPYLPSAMTFLRARYSLDGEPT